MTHSITTGRHRETAQSLLITSRLPRQILVERAWFTLVMVLVVNLTMGTATAGRAWAQSPVNPPDLSRQTPPPSAPATPTNQAAGNQAPSAQQQQQPALKSPPAAVPYVVRDGDTLESIAKAWYGTKDAVRTILEANKDLRADQPLHAGQRITLPSIDQNLKVAQVTALPEGEMRILQAVIMAVEGDHAQWRAAPTEKWQSARVDDLLAPGAAIRTGPHTKVTLRIGMNASVLIDRNSNITIPEVVQAGSVLRTRLMMNYGMADVKVDRVGLENDFEIKTPSATLAVRGTGLEVRWDAIHGFEAYGVPTNHLRAIEIGYINHLKAYLTSLDGSTEEHPLPGFEAFSRTYFVPLIGALAPEEAALAGTFVTQSYGMIDDLGLQSSFGHAEQQGTMMQVQQGQNQGGTGQGGCCD